MKSVKFVTCLLAAAALLAVSCNKEKDTTKKNPHEGVKMQFTLTLTSLEGDVASVRVRHDADDAKLTWYACLVEDLESSIEDVVDVATVGLKQNDLYVGKTKSVSLSDLEPETDYRFIAFGVDIEDDGTVWTYGTPSELTFKTSKDLNVIFSLTEAVLNRNSATFTASYDVEEDDAYTWYGFLTEEVGEISSVIDKQIRTISESDFKSGKNAEISLSDLKFSTDYRYIITGVNMANGKVTKYGTPAEISFSTESRFYEETSWSVTYDGKVWRSNNGKYALDINVSTSNSPHCFICMPKDIFSFKPVDEYIEGEYDTMVSYIAKYGYTWSDFVQTTDVGWYGSYQGLGDYVAVLFGLEQNGSDYVLSGGYKTFEFTVAASTGADAAYQAWFGEWIVGDDYWTISSYDPGVSLQITGVCGVEESIKVIAQYNNGTIYLSEQYVSGIETVDTESAGRIQARLKLIGWFPYQGSSSLWGGTALMFSAKISTANPSQATISPVKPSSSYSAFTGCQFWYENVDESDNNVYRYGEGKGCFWDSKTMDRREDPTPAYSAWLGDWKIKRPEYTAESQRGKADNEPTGEYITDTWNIAEKVVNRSFVITGFDNYDVSFDAVFNQETGAIEVSEQYVTSVTNNGTTYYYYIMGLYVEDSDTDYSIWGGSEKVLTATIGGDGVASITGCELSKSYTDPDTQEVQEVHGQFVGMEVFAASGTSIVNFLADNWGEFYRFPCTFSKAESTTTFKKMSGGKYMKAKASANASSRPSCSPIRDNSAAPKKTVKLATSPLKAVKK
ncbi:MAG: hypothetical protein J6W59_04465 [Bacteroidales bacterium]|nr:hypothetical protein [Bacteroidales bacterium]